MARLGLAREIDRSAQKRQRRSSPSRTSTLPGRSSSRGRKRRSTARSRLRRDAASGARSRFRCRRPFTARS
jgi:hypothetical protein